jgi:hypothetical protein
MATTKIESERTEQTGTTPVPEDPPKPSAAHTPEG